MVDETIYRQVLRSTDPLSCVFDKALFAHCCQCSLSNRHLLAEREHVSCRDGPSRALCFSLHEQLLHNATFALKHLHDDDPLTHAQEMKLQCGGLRGVQYALNGTDEIDDVSALILAVREKYGGLESLPFSVIMQFIASSKLRKRSET